MTTLTLDGISVEMADSKDAANIKSVFDKLTKQIADQAAAEATKDADHAKAIAAKDAQLATKDAAIDALTAKVIDDAAMDEKVAARAELVGLAKAIAPNVATAGLSDAAIRKAVVVAKIGDAAVAGKADAYVDARFDILADTAKAEKPDAFRDAVAGGLQPVVTGDTAPNAAYLAMIADMKSPAVASKSN